MNRRLAALAAAVAAALVLSACVPERAVVTPTVEPEAPSASASSSTEVGTVLEQEVAWSSCGELECATIQVPVDWSVPDGPTLDLELNRHVATDPDRRIGSLLINPGGPGGSGLDLTEYLVSSAGEDLVAAYDVVGFDPRGVGESSPLRCGDAAELDAYYLTDLTLETQAQIDDAREDTAAFAARCRELSGPIAEHMDTVSVARDMDLIRQLLGDSQLHYLGFSYGTQIGATYAQLFPENVGRMVLDGAVDFLMPADQLAAEQAAGFEKALANFIAWCLSDADECPLESDPAAATLQVQRLLEGARDSGYPGLGSTRVNGNTMVYGVVVTLYDQASWPYLASGLAEIIEDGTAAIIEQLAAFYLDKDPSTGEYLSNSMEAFTGVSCLDAGYQEPYTVQSLSVFRSLMETRSPTFGWWFASSLGCDGWPWEAAERVTSLDRAGTGEPILVVGTTNDPATPYAWAESLTEQIGNAALLTYEGEGHTAYGRSNQCVIDAVDGYLVDGRMPSSGTVC